MVNRLILNFKGLINYLIIKTLKKKNLINYKLINF